MNFSEPASKTWFVKVAPPPFHATEAPSIPSVNAAVRVARQPTLSSTDLKF